MVSPPSALIMKMLSQTAVTARREARPPMLHCKPVGGRASRRAIDGREHRLLMHNLIEITPL